MFVHSNKEPFKVTAAAWGKHASESLAHSSVVVVLCPPPPPPPRNPYVVDLPSPLRSPSHPPGPAASLAGRQRAGTALEKSTARPSGSGCRGWDEEQEQQLRGSLCARRIPEGQRESERKREHAFDAQGKCSDAHGRRRRHTRRSFDPQKATPNKSPRACFQLSN